MGKFNNVAINKDNKKYSQSIKRETEIHERQGEIRSPFTRDYTRVLHSRSYSRLKNKTQVFFATQNDHICTRIEHVNHVSSIGVTIAKHLGLNEELILSIATGHDLGHAPFGHTGERILNKLSLDNLNKRFWHEKNSLYVVDSYETLTSSDGCQKNLNLTYATRDGIISHCGEVEDSYLYPRDIAIDLNNINKANEYPPYTWEGCVVKLADNIAYIGRDIEDALRLNILNDENINELNKILQNYSNIDVKKSNNTTLIHTFVTDLCASSSPNNGLKFSKNCLDLLKEVKRFNYANIYENDRLVIFHDYAKLIFNSIFTVMMKFYDGTNTIAKIKKEYCDAYPELCSTYISKLERYASNINNFERDEHFKNKYLYDLNNKKDFIQSIIDYLSSMTDSFAIKIFNELTTL